MAGGRELAWVSNSYADTVSVIDVAAAEVVDTIRMDHGEVHDVEQWPSGVVLQLANTPMNPTFTLDRSEIWIPNPEGCNIAAVDPATNAVSRVIELSMKPNDVAFTPDGERAVVTLLGYATGKQGAVTVVDVATGKATEPIMVGTQPEEAVLMPDGKRAFVVSKSLWVIDVDANEVESEKHLPYWCYDALLSPDAATLYLTATFGEDKIVAVDTATGAVSGIIDVLMPACMCFLPDGRMLVSNVYNSSVQVVDLESGAVSEPVPVPPMPSYMAVTEAGDRIVLCHPTGEAVTLLDGESLAVVAEVPVDLGPCAVAIGTVP